jgi:hypothetical protein
MEQVETAIRQSDRFTRMAPRFYALPQLFAIKNLVAVAIQ